MFGPGGDEPLLWYEGSGTTDRRWLHADERGSIVATSGASGGKLSIGSYDEYGVPGSANSGRFGYTGQAWLPEVGLWYYKARMYVPGLGRFLQTDPIGYADGPNWYGYVRSDPVNLSDPWGLNHVVIERSATGTDTFTYDDNGNLLSIESTGPDIVVSNRSVRTNVWNDNAGGPLRSDYVFGGGGVSQPQSMQPQMCPAAYTPNGDTKGEHPVAQGDRYNTDLPGGYAAALATFEGLTRLEAAQSGGGGGSHVTVDPRRPTTVFLSNSGNIGLRYAFSNGNLVFRVDINPNTFSLNKAETIHFNGSGRGNMCPTR